MDKLYETGKVTWQNIMTGGPDNPSTRRWNVAAFPTTYVLDQAGILRAANVHGEALETSIEALLHRPDPADAK